MKYRILFAAIAMAAASTSMAQESKLSITGYFDLEAEVGNGGATHEYLTFDQHHFNMIMQFKIGRRLNVLGEMEWEHGIELTRSSGSGKIYIARSWLEYTAADALRLRLGKFLPPFGIFNELHDATPTFIATELPQSFYGKHALPGGSADRLFAKFGNGLWALGTLYRGAWDLQYDAYVSNGRGAKPYESDDNANKGAGGRLVLTPPMRGLAVGGSYYRERNGAAANTRMSASALQLSLSHRGWHLISEAALFDLEKVRGSGTASNPFVPDGSYRNAAAFYVEGGYRIRDVLMPFVRYDRFDPDRDAGSDREHNLTLGLNIRPTWRLAFKGEVHFLRWDGAGSQDHEMGIASVAVAF